MNFRFWIELLSVYANKLRQLHDDWYNKTKTLTAIFSEIKFLLNICFLNDVRSCSFVKNVNVIQGPKTIWLRELNDRSFRILIAKF